jgi:serine/threonine-protein kinase
VAVKLLHAGRARPEGEAVLQEARLLARVRHPNVATVYDADEIDGRVGLWMEFIHGRTLSRFSPSGGNSMTGR